MSDATPTKLPSFDSILLDTSLYARLPISNLDRKKLADLRAHNFQIDAHCIQCEASSIFKTNRTVGGGRGLPMHSEWMFKPCQFACDLICQRCGLKYSYHFRLDEDCLQKIGQFPSLEDIGSASIAKYRKLLRQSDFAELRRATGLYSHGIGIGSFVYLRRIFERLIKLHHDELKAAGTPVADFDRLRMDEKIAAMGAVLPPALVRNSKTYQILSKGLHELDEETCSAFFPVVKAAIIQILEQDLAKRHAKEAEAELEKQIANIASEIS